MNTNEGLYKESFKKEFIKLSSSTEDMAEAFYRAQKRIDEDRSKKKMKNLAIGTVGGAAVTYGGAKGLGYLHRKGYTGRVGKNIDSKLMAASRILGDRAGVYSGEATNAAAASYKNALKEGVTEFTRKMRGGNLLNKTIKKILFKG